MAIEPGTWHHGIMARWWAEFTVAQPDELAYDRAAVERFGQPALDLACGTGRLLRHCRRLASTWTAPTCRPTCSRKPPGWLRRTA